jgi:hypothetical protein
MENKLSPVYNPEIEKVHRNNAENLREIIGLIGWPTISKVGVEASEAAWLVCPAFNRRTYFYEAMLRINK